MYGGRSESDSSESAVQDCVSVFCAPIANAGWLVTLSKEPGDMSKASAQGETTCKSNPSGSVRSVPGQGHSQTCIGVRQVVVVQGGGIEARDEASDFYFFVWRLVPSSAKGLSVPSPRQRNLRYWKPAKLPRAILGSLLTQLARLGASTHALRSLRPYSIEFCAWPDA